MRLERACQAKNRLPDGLAVHCDLTFNEVISGKLCGAVVKDAVGAKLAATTMVDQGNKAQAAYNFALTDCAGAFWRGLPGIAPA